MVNEGKGREEEVPGTKNSSKAKLNQKESADGWRKIGGHEGVEEQQMGLKSKPIQ